MKSKDSELRLLIRESILAEGIFDGKMGTGKAAPALGKEKAAAKAAAIKNIGIMLKPAVTRIKTAVAPVRDEVDEIEDAGELLAQLQGFEPEGGKVDKETAAKIAYTYMRVVAEDAADATELLDIIKKKTHVRSAILLVPGMLELQGAVDETLESEGKDPAKAVKDAFTVLKNLIKKYSLA